MDVRRVGLDIISCGAKNMSEDKIWRMVDAMTEMEFIVKDGVIVIVDPSHVCMMEIRNVKLKDGPWIMEGKGAKRKPVEFDGLYGNPLNIPKMELPCKISLGSTENIAKVLKQMRHIGYLCTIESNSQSQYLEISVGGDGYGNIVNRIRAIIPTTNIDGDARSQYSLSYLIPLFQYLNPTSLEFGPNFPIKVDGKNWTFFLAPRIDADF